MRILLAGAALLAGFGAMPALAADWTGFYAGFYGGESIRNDSNVDLTAASGSINLDAGSVQPGVHNLNGIDPDVFDILETAATGWEFLGAGAAEGYITHGTFVYDAGLTLGGVFGYSAGNGFRFEGDWSHTSFAARDVSFGSAILETIHGDVDRRDGEYEWDVVDETTTPPVPIDRREVGSSAEFFLADVWFDFDNSSNFTPYLGGGAGLAHIHTSFEGTDSAVFALAGQAGAGVRVDLNDTSFLDFGYRYKLADASNITASGYIDDINGTTYLFSGFKLKENGPLAVQTLQVGYNLILK